MRADLARAPPVFPVWTPLDSDRFLAVDHQPGADDSVTKRWHFCARRRWRPSQVEEDDAHPPAKKNRRVSCATEVARPVRSGEWAAARRRRTGGRTTQIGCAARRLRKRPERRPAFAPTVDQLPLLPLSSSEGAGARRRALLDRTSPGAAPTIAIASRVPRGAFRPPPRPMKLENNLLNLSLQRIVRSVALSELRGFLYNKPGFAIGTALPVLLQPRLHCDVSHTASTASLSKQLARGRYSQQEYVEARLVGRDWPAARTLPSELHFVHAARKLHAPPLSQTRRVLGNEADASCVFFSLCSTHCAHLVLTFLLGIVVRLQHGLRLERPQPRPRRSAGLPLRGLSPALRGRPAQRGRCRGCRGRAGFGVAVVCVLFSSSRRLPCAKVRG